MIPIYNAPIGLITPNVEDAFRGAWCAMCVNEGWLDSRGIPTPHDGSVMYQDNEMAFVQYVADEGVVQYHHSGAVLRELATHFGYKKSANLKAAILEVIYGGLLVGRLGDDKQQWLTVTDYGRETLARWEAHKEDVG